MAPSGRHYVGAISGTSVDGLDLALIRVNRGRVEFLAGDTVAFPPDLQRELKAFGAAQHIELDRLGAVDRELGAFIGTSIIDFLERASMPRDRVRAIGSHGQTIRHGPHGRWPFTIQIGDANTIAEVTAIDTYADFRRRDMAAGGQGAPLVPPFHAALFGSGRRERVVLNVGGIANITQLPRSRSRPLLGFDTGPGNALLDHWASTHLQRNFDDGGRWARSGQIVPDLLRALLAEPYLALPPPKSTGKELFNGAWLAKALAAHPGVAPADVQATLVELTARTVADAIAQSTPECRTVIVCGGGRLNATLMDRLAALLSDCEVTTTDALGYNGDWIEAGAFAWLAYRAAIGKPGNAPAVTGAMGPRILGALHPGGR